ncbi:MAG: 2,3-bisphosphoglycerate-independent phosphoglycerate mutase [Bacteroidota bacterium]
MSDSNKVILVILDGWGHGQNPEVSALAKASTPYVDSLYKKYPNTELVTYGEEVGLPAGQMGNSEVGHLNIGAGRVVYQELARINKAIREKTLNTNETLLAGLAYAKANDKSVHLIGLLSDGGVHSHINHLKALCDITQENGLKNVFIHAFMDGRDTAQQGGLGYLRDLKAHIAKQSVQIASVTGRYYAMDRDNRWERIKLAYDAMVNGEGEKTEDVLKTMSDRYEAGETDEFIKPIINLVNNEPVATIQADDVVIFYNFRTDRPREITTVLTQEDKPDFGMKKLPLRFLTMTRYDESFTGIDILFTKDNIQNTLGEVLANAGKTQVRIAETEKYPHVTFFFNGGREATFEGEHRIVIPSPKVATYDLQPEMSALEATEQLIEYIQEHQPDFVCLNYANTDMVGHTGDFAAAMKAAETVDSCLGQLMEIALENGYEGIVIADHGNSDIMINEDGTPHTAHTTNPVPCFFISSHINGRKIADGKLGDVAPTILGLMGLAVPNEMDGKNLVSD